MKKVNEEMTAGGIAANRMGNPGSAESSIGIYDKLMSTATLDPRLKKLLDKLEGGDSPGKRAVQSRIVSAWVRLHGLPGDISNEGGGGE